MEQNGLLTEAGQAKIDEAKQNGQWDAPKAGAVSEDHLAELSGVLENHQLAYANFLKMSPSVQKTYTKGYFAAKTPDGRAKRLAWMVDRLEQNLKPM